MMFTVLKYKDTELFCICVLNEAEMFCPLFFYNFEYHSRVFFFGFFSVPVFPYISMDICACMFCSLLNTQCICNFSGIL